MSKIIDAAQNRWHQINAREQKLIILAAVVTLVTATYLGLWKPLHNQIHHLRTATPEARTQLVWMQNQRSLVNSIQRKHRASPTANILSIIETSITTHGLNGQVTQLEPVSPNGARLKFNNVNFNVVTKWISALNHEHGISVEKANFDKSNNVGLVNVRLILRSSS